MLDQTFESAAMDMINACGGPKSVGLELRPEKTAEDAGKWLLHTLNGNRREILSPQDLQVLLRIGRRHGCHILSNYMNGSTGYEAAKPVDLAQEAEAANRDVDRLLCQAKDRLDKVNLLRSIIEGAAK